MPRTSRDKRVTAPDGTFTVASKSANGEGSIYREVDGAEGQHLLTSVVVDFLRRRRRAQADERRIAGSAWPRHAHDNRPIDLVFTTTTGGLLLRQSVAKAVAAAAARAGVDPKGLGTRSGRSTAITALYTEEGLDLADIARYVGHASPATTAGYVRHLGRDRPPPPRRPVGYSIRPSTRRPTDPWSSPHLPTSSADAPPSKVLDEHLRGRDRRRAAQLARRQVHNARSRAPHQPR